MTTQQLLALDLLLIVIGAVAFLTAGVLTVGIGGGSSRGRSVGAGVGAAVGFLACVGRIAVLLVLADRGWWFAGDKLIVALPLALIGAGCAAAIAVPFLLAAVRGRPAQDRRPAAAASLLVAGYGAAAGVVVTFAIAYPISLAGAGAVIALVAGVSGLTWLALTRRGSRGLRVVLVLVSVVPMVLTAGLAFYRNLQPVLVGAGTGGHGHLAAGAGTGGGTTTPVTPALSVTDLRTPADIAVPVRSFTLTARQETVTLPSGVSVEAWTFGSLPGPELRVRQGDLVQVTLENRDIADGVTLHWHGYPVPNAEDGVAGVTQDAVAPGESFTYRFVADVAGTYWYHAHQVSSEAVRRGLFGILIVEPTEPTGEADVVFPIHTFDGTVTVGGTDGTLGAQIPTGRRVRVRLINTDPEPHRVSISRADFSVVAADGTDVIGPTTATGDVLRIPAGGRYDVSIEMPSAPVTFAVEGAPGVGLQLDSGDDASTAVPGFLDGPDLDLLTYGAPAPVPGMTAAVADREATLVLDRQFRFLDGIPTFAQTVNGDVHPFVPPIAVREGELVRLTVVNRGGDTHPMHPHGHKVLVESRDGVPVAGSPLWLDTFDVQPGEVWTVLLRADNPGIWMAHCHNLEHATQGMVIHLTYEGVSTPFRLGGGSADNRPE
jgi:FtsP/CotA-like multicopper oxidase with cupredoxin domain